MEPFSSVVFSENSMTAWIGVFGTLIGVVIGGIISYVVAQKTVSIQEKNVKDRENEFNRKIKIHLDNYLQYSFCCLFFIIPDPAGNHLPTKKELNRELDFLRIVIRELDNIAFETIPSKYIESISNVKILFQILNVEIERVINNYDEPKTIAGELKKIIIKERTIKIIEHYSKISDDKDYWISVIREIEEVYKQNQAGQ